MELTICDACAEPAGNPYYTLEGLDLCRDCYTRLKSHPERLAEVKAQTTLRVHCTVERA